MLLNQLEQELKLLSNPRQAKKSTRFFKTAKGKYAEGDIFLGIKTPIQRKIAKKYFNLNSKQIEKLLHNKIHNYRFIALLILIAKYQKGGEKIRKQIYKFYLKNSRWVNNWDLVDISAPKIVGNYLLDKKEQRKILSKLAKSKNLWEKRIAILSTFAFIKNKQFKDALKISRILLADKNDLIHKAVGWMLREIGKINQPAEEKFLKKHYQIMPRTMLRYAIEKFSKPKRKFYLKKKTNS